MKAYNPVPSNKIADHVHRILVIENYHVANPFTLPLFANGSPTLLFLTTKGTIDNNATGHLTLFGQTVFPETLTIKDNFTIIAYFFKPFSLFSLFGISPLEITDRPVDLNLLPLPKTSELQEKLLNAGKIDYMLRILDDYISDLVIKTNADCRIIKYATTEIANNTSKESLVLVQKDLCVTERTFQRMFEKMIGIAPNLYRRICQFNSAFEQLNRRKYYKLSDIAFENGYADQSHYIRAFKEFTNITPKDYLKFAEQG
jgi:AraC-like DNA-binding protein